MSKQEDENKKEKKSRRKNNVFNLLLKIFLPFIIILFIIFFVVAVISSFVYFLTVDDGTYKEEDWSNVPYEVEQYNKGLVVNDNGEIEKTETTTQLWNKLIKYNSPASRYLSSPKELAKLINAEIVSLYPDTRENSDVPANWDDILNPNTNELQGIVKFERNIALNKKTVSEDDVRRLGEKYREEQETARKLKETEEEEKKKEEQKKKEAKEKGEEYVPKEEQTNTSNPTSIEGFIMIGDSWTVGLEYLSSVKSSGLKTFSRSGAAAEYWITNYSQIGSQNAKGVIVYLGLNNTPGTEAMKTLLGKLKSSYSNVPIYVLKLPHVAKAVDNGMNPVTWNSQIDTRNREIESYCSSNGLNFIDATEGLIGSDGYLSDNYESGGGYHLTPTGYELLFQNIKKQILNGGTATNTIKEQTFEEWMNENGFTQDEKGNWEEAETITMTYATEEEFQKLIDAYKQNPNEDTKRNMLSRFTIQKNISSTSGGVDGTTQSLIEDGDTIDIPEPYGTDYTYMGWQLITSPTSKQFELIETAGMNFDSEGFGKINGRYVVAVRPKFGTVGDYIDFYLEDGTVLPCIVGDIKGDDADSEWGHNGGRCLLEFVVDYNTWYPSHANPGTSACRPEWDPRVVKAVKGQNYFNNPNFGSDQIESKNDVNNETDKTKDKDKTEDKTKDNDKNETKENKTDNSTSSSKTSKNENNSKTNIFEDIDLEAKPDFNEPQYRSLNVYTQWGSYGQCTWFSWGKFYDVYGFDPGASGNGVDVAGEIVNSHPDKFELSTEPKPGAVFSCAMGGSAYSSAGHTGFITYYDGNMIKTQESNVIGAGVLFERELTIDQFKATFPNGLVFANPIDGADFSDGSSRANNSNSKKQKSDYVIKIATFSEMSVVSQSNLPGIEGESSTSNADVTTKTIDYQNLVRPYTLPFDYLWALLVVGEDKDFVMDLADLVYGSELIVAINDNVNIQTHVVNVETPQTTTVKEYTTEKNGGKEYLTGDKTETVVYTTTTTTVNVTDTVKEELRRANTWIVEYDKDITFKKNVTQGIPSQKLTIEGKELEEKEEKEEYEDHNSGIKTDKKTITNVKQEDGTQTEEDLVEKTEAVTSTPNIREKTEKKLLKTKNVREFRFKEKNFVTLLLSNQEAKSSILSASRWLFDILEANESTKDVFVDLTKYLLYKVTDSNEWGITEFDFSIFDPKSFNDVSSIGDGNYKGISTEAKIWCALRRAGYSEEITAGILGNIYQECNFDPACDGGSSIGIVQWEWFKDDLIGYGEVTGKGWQDLDVQLDYLLAELASKQGVLEGGYPHHILDEVSQYRCI